MRRSLLRWWPLLAVALMAAACTEEEPGPPGNTGGTGGSGGSAGTGGSAVKDSGAADTSNPQPDTGTPTDDGGADDKSDATPPTGDGSTPSCTLDLPTALDRPPSGGLPCELLPPGFMSP